MRRMAQRSSEPGKAPCGAIATKLSKVGEDIRYPAQTGGCFIKGTRVHTKEGLKPIEEIQIGDYVLSSPEDGSGSPEYKRVVNTFVHENKTVVRIYMTALDWSYTWGQSQSSPVFSVSATENHPFWVEGVGWTRADVLKAEDILRKADGSLAKVSSLNRVYRTSREGIGWIPNGFNLENSDGSLFDYANYDIVEDDGRDRYLSAEVLESDDPYLKVRVYNFEVEDFHTYYVGAKGFWVHNANCDGPEAASKSLQLGQKPQADASSTGKARG